MNRLTWPVLRAGAMAVAAAGGLMALASTGQTPSGFVPAALGGPLGVFDSSAAVNMTDVMAIGDGPADARELAALLKTTGPSPAATGPLQATLSAGTLPNISELTIVAPEASPSSAASDKQSLDLRPVLDNKGRVDCTRAVSCQTDPATNVTTVTFPDGVVAVVQKVNDLTLISYQTVGDVIGALLPQFDPVLPAAAAPAPAAAQPPQNPAPEAGGTAPAAPPVDPGPVAPAAPEIIPDITASKVRPNLTITTPPQDFTPAKPGGPSPGGVNTPGNVSDAWNTLTGGLQSAVGSVVDSIGKALGPGASTKP